MHEVPYIYAVRARPHPTKQASPDAKEVITGHQEISYERLWKLCVTGALHDALTIVATLRLNPHFRTGRFEIDEQFVHDDSTVRYHVSS
jgi:hypothetical protein